MNHFCFDIETLSIESTAVILSAAMVWFDPADTNVTYEQLVDRCTYVKFDAREQKTLGRHVSKDTLTWWEKQGDMIKKLCLYPSPRDKSAVDGLTVLNKYFSDHGDPKSFIWVRGSMDQPAIASLAKVVGLPEIAPYNNWMDTRTAIRLLKETSSWTGYCQIPGFDQDRVDKHNPIADIALDVLMLQRGV